ncbi:competence protein ComEC [Nocardioides scoriae]|uniref:Competence protein ComEC n=1 Tax=Nocardioides scoriae TaxID=642780 RepID=A0A1H1LYA7_9ACTN|nr:ComEC/Rec2 family competence protein [Nocardioides scoriae]SDR79584.1 competence protein ComEC [Nocardioides scoriae]
MTVPPLTAPTAAGASAGSTGARGLDLRMPVLALVAWGAALVALLAPPWWLFVLGAAVLVRAWQRRRRGRAVLTLLAWALAGAAVAGSALLRADGVRSGPVAELAREQAVVRVELVTTSDPAVRPGRFGDLVVVRTRVEEVTGRGVRREVRAPVLVLGDRSWRAVPLGSRVVATGRLDTPRTDDLAGVLAPRGPPEVTDHPGPLLDGAAALRASIRHAVADRAAAPRALVPALVDGDDAAMPEGLVEDFRTAGLTHLLAVSGTNLTLVVGCLLLLARWAGVRARGLVVVGLLGVAGFLLLARAEPSVVRAAAMGAVGLLGLGQHGRRHGTRALGAAVLLLLVWDPWMALSLGFALSALATAGILWLAPGWRDRMARWLPRWAAEALAVPLAAQLACTPLVAALSGQVSLVAVAANLLAAPAVGPATVLGLLGGVVGLVWPAVGEAVAAPGAWSAAWIVAVAERSADVPTAAAAWPTSAPALALLTGLVVLLALLVGVVVARRWATLAAVALVVVVLLVPLPTPGWPPRGWVMVACDVGQGDGLVLHAGPGAAVVVDAGPDPRAIDRCLDRLGVRRVPLVVLTHFHADHVDGLAGVLGSREVGAVEVTGLAEPASGARLVAQVAAAAGVPVRRAAYGEARELGPLRWQVVAPAGAPPAGSGSPPNDASVVLLVESRGVRLLLMGDEEDDSQTRLLRETGGVRADVLKVAHHGSASQDPALVRATGARLAVISVGADNDYGHPAPSLLALLRDAGMRVVRTDQQGDVAVVADPGLGVETRGRLGP